MINKAFRVFGFLLVSYFVVVLVAILLQSLSYAHLTFWKSVGLSAFICVVVYSLGKEFIEGIEKEAAQKEKEELFLKIRSEQQELETNNEETNRV